MNMSQDVKSIRVGQGGMACTLHVDVLAFMVFSGSYQSKSSREPFFFYQGPTCRVATMSRPIIVADTMSPRSAGSGNGVTLWLHESPINSCVLGTTTATIYIRCILIEIYIQLNIPNTERIPSSAVDTGSFVSCLAVDEEEYGVISH
jgi:hypothetical protein